MAGVVVIFDFDRTIIEKDSDDWVATKLGASALFDLLLPTLPWNSLMVVPFFSFSSSPFL
jgi:pyridoxal phosphate phosphatase PHOSPHO2